ncbi:MAG: hypothetical protein JSW59_14300 [Phycisphaerales bacterium]|nr:MAG: hypothetical protein JSW59_14300 [Phycisphaerales bacterium]
MADAIARHCQELNRCNQRGGRMLSIFDLLAAKTLDLDLAAYLMARISKGASFMVGAAPGRAGKTTVMCALLNFVPVDVSLAAATPEAVRRAADQAVVRRVCYVCHEIGSGPYYAYLWSDALRTYCELSERGHMLATNLHADDISQARSQVCGTNGVPTDHFNSFELLIFLRVGGGYSGARRWIDLVYSSDGSSEHELVFTTAKNSGASPTIHADPGYVAACRDFLGETAAQSRTIEQTRECVIEFLVKNSS